MKVVYLILYLWHADAMIITSGGGLNGGPVLAIQRMESVRECEAVGLAAKQLADSIRPNPGSTNKGEFIAGSPPAVYRCIEVPK